MENSNDIKGRFEAWLAEYELLFIAFGAGWCAPCESFSRVYEEVSQQFPRIQFLKVDIEQDKEWVDFLNLYSVPHLMAIKDGLVVYADSGNITKETLLDLARQLLKLDVSVMEPKTHLV